MNYDKNCHVCKKKLPYETRILRTETCPWCAADLYCCMNCKFHVQSRYNECEIPNTSRIKERDRRNFCGAFVFREGNAVEDNSAAEAKAALNDLFKF